MLSNAKADREIIRDIVRTDIDIHALEDMLRLNLTREMLKNDKDRDYDAVAEYVNALIEVKNMDENELDTSKGIELIMKNTVEKSSKSARIKHQKNRFIFAFASIAIVVILLTSNFVVAGAFNLNIFSSIVKLSNNLVTFNFSNKNTSSRPPVNMTPQTLGAIKQKCVENSVAPLIPKYLPNNMILGRFNVKQHGDGKEDILIFLTNKTNEKNTINYLIQYCTAKAALPAISGLYISSSEKVSEKGIDYFIMGTTVVFEEGNYYYTINTTFSRDELLKIIQSY